MNHLKGLISAFDRVVGSIVTATGSISGIFILGLMLLVTIDVIGRYVLNQPLPGTFEISESVAVFMAFLSFAWSQRRRRNIRIEIGTKYFPTRARCLAEILALFIGLVVFSLITWLGLKSGLESWEAREYMTGIVPLPLYPSKLIVPVGGAFMCLQYLTEICRNTSYLLKPKKGAEPWIQPLPH